MIADFPELQVDECAGLIELTQANGLDQPDCVRLHPIHLRYLAERFGLAETSDPQAATSIERLQRHMLILRERIAHLDEQLDLAPDPMYGDLDSQRAFAFATREFADEFCADFEGSVPISTPPTPAPTTPPIGEAKTPGNGGVKDPQKRDPSARDVPALSLGQPLDNGCASDGSAIACASAPRAPTEHDVTNRHVTQRDVSRVTAEQQPELAL